MENLLKSDAPPPTGVSKSGWRSLLNSLEEYREAVEEHRAAVDAGQRLGGGAEPSECAEYCANLAVQLLLAEKVNTCLACPPGCGSCNGSNCECYEHQSNHPGAQAEDNWRNQK